MSRFLGKDYNIVASMGHIRDLPKNRLGIDIDHNFKPQYETPIDKKKVVSMLMQEAGRAKEIILATDLDREGEAIAYHASLICLNSIGKLADKSSKFKRIIFHEITKSAILDALEHPKTINKNLVDAQQARRVLDRLVGYKLSPLLWQKIRRGLSAGRVQSPAVRLIVEREREITAFKAEEYWIIEVELRKQKTKQSFMALLSKINDKKAEITNQQQAKNISEKLEKSQYQVFEVKINEVKVVPPPPFITSTLQRLASSLFHWPAKKTMRIAQQLYENGLITYHRTDSVNLSQQALTMAKKYILQNFSAKYYSGGRVYKTKSKLAQEAHEAIRTTRLEIGNGKWELGGDEEKLYHLIFNRFIASQMTAQLLEKVVVSIKTNTQMELKAIGQKELFDGFKRLFKQKEAEGEQPLPVLSANEILDFVKLKTKQQFTQPPLRYSEGMLIKALEERGIGRPSTYATIISTIQTRQYVEKEGGRFKPTAIGETVVDFLVKYFSKVVDYDFTANIEDDLDSIANHTKLWQPVIADFYRPFNQKLLEVAKNAKRLPIQVEKTGKKCPKCHKGEQVIRTGRYGKFLACLSFPKCDWKDVYIEKISGVKCPDCGSQVVWRKTKKGKRFYGCNKWPKCKWASWRKPQNTIILNKVKNPAVGISTT